MTDLMREIADSAIDRWPRLALAATRPVIAYGRVQQRRLKRKVERGAWPPRA